MNYRLWAIFGPAMWPLWLLIVAVAHLAWSRGSGAAMRRGRWFTVASLALFTLFGITPFGSWLIEPLEQRLPISSLHTPPATILVLAGGENLPASEWRKALETSDAGERVFEGAALAHRFPNARLAIAGGVHLKGSTVTDVALVQDAWKRLGIPASRIVVIDRTMDTCANALGARDLPRPVLLVTSAAHMPRSVACFRAAGLDPLRYPVDYRAIPPGRSIGPFTSNLDRVDFALHEWIGLAWYRLRGRTAELLPSAR